MRQKENEKWKEGNEKDRKKEKKGRHGGSYYLNSAYGLILCLRWTPYV